MTHPQSTPEPEPQDPREVYRMVQQSPQVCSNCLRAVPDAESIEPWSWRETVQPALAPVYLAGDGAETVGARGQYRVRPAPCPHCGVGSTSDQVRPLDKDTLLRRAAYLSVTLRQLGVPHESQVLLRVVRARKQVPRLASRDDETLAAAVAAGIAARDESASGEPAEARPAGGDRGLSA